MKVKQMNFNDTIGIYENALSKEQCKDLIKYYDNNSSSHFQGITNGGDDLTVKNSTDLMLWEGNEMDMLCDVSNQHINKYIESLGELDKYDPFQMFSEGSLYRSWQIQKYEKGIGHYKGWHNEEPHIKANSNRMLVTMFYLNDVKEGGETCFLYSGLKIKPKAGTFIVWPTPWPYVHNGEIPISSDKYIATTWLLSAHNYDSDI